jgi:hypothetical protein
MLKRSVLRLSEAFLLLSSAFMDSGSVMLVNLYPVCDTQLKDGKWKAHA